MTPPNPPKPPPKAASDSRLAQDREAKLAQALRANLRRRKAPGRAAAKGVADEGDKCS
ncbi:MAG: hypothetical protein MH112_06700 [Phenylobacterium sp.]|uniref:hypothetical protein n=1 Tax=Phenylobacterium sp. TaxID=1871053 RepID=UPI0025EDD53D|nr:hypothetical protein [Phenylobacterium sp.]MCG9916035.1 hypothetical protein [Phenylobacterium sp.]